MECLAKCKKYKGNLQKLMAKKDIALFIQAFHDVMKMINSDPEIIDQLVKDFKMSRHSVQETLFMSKFLDNLEAVAKKEEEKKQQESLKH
jgi:hypothetical protein